MTTRRHLICAGAALLVVVIELSATLGSINGESLDLVPGWGPTRPGDIWAVKLTIASGAALFAVIRFPSGALAVTSGAFVVFMLRDYEFGMTLPAMAVIFILTTQGKCRLLVLAAAAACLGAPSMWIARRTSTIIDEGSALLAWVAFGTVSALFFLLPVLLGELIRLRGLARTVEK